MGFFIYCIGNALLHMPTPKKTSKVKQSGSEKKDIFFSTEERPGTLIIVE
jgi:hypothetical protein